MRCILLFYLLFSIVLIGNSCKNTSVIQNTSSTANTVAADTATSVETLLDSTVVTTITNTKHAKLQKLYKTQYPQCNKLVVHQLDSTDMYVLVCNPLPRLHGSIAVVHFNPSSDTLTKVVPLDVFKNSFKVMVDSACWRTFAGFDKPIIEVKIKDYLRGDISWYAYDSANASFAPLLSTQYEGIVSISAKYANKGLLPTFDDIDKDGVTDIILDGIIEYNQSSKQTKVHKIFSWKAADSTFVEQKGIISK